MASQRLVVASSAAVYGEAETLPPERRGSGGFVITVCRIKVGQMNSIDYRRRDQMDYKLYHVSKVFQCIYGAWPKAGWGICSSDPKVCRYDGSRAFTPAYQRRWWPKLEIFVHVDDVCSAIQRL